MKASTLQTSMRPSSEFRHGASSSSSSSTHFRFQHGTFGELSEEEDNTVTMATMIEQHKKWMMVLPPIPKHEESETESSNRFWAGRKPQYAESELESEEGCGPTLSPPQEQGNPLQFQHNNFGSKKEEHVTIQGRKEEEYVAIQEEGTPLQLQHNNLGSKKEEHVTIQGRKEEEYVTIQVEPEPDSPQMQGVAAESSFNHSGSMAHSESEIMSYAVPIILLVAEVILGLGLFGVI